MNTDPERAFPVPNSANVNDQMGMTLRDYFAAKAPAPTSNWLEMQMQFDRGRNPHNDSYKPVLRDAIEIDAEWRFKWADAMLKARQS